MNITFIRKDTNPNTAGVDCVPWVLLMGLLCSCTDDPDDDDNGSTDGDDDESAVCLWRRPSESLEFCEQQHN